MNKKKILVTGSAGYIGSHVVNYFQKNNFEVHTLDRNKPSFKSKKHYLIDLEKDHNRIFKINYSCIIHLASYTLHESPLMILTNILLVIENDK